jgi:hypothetical protein
MKIAITLAVLAILVPPLVLEREVNHQGRHKYMSLRVTAIFKV